MTKWFLLTESWYIGNTNNVFCIINKTFIWTSSTFVFFRYDHLRKEASDYQPADTDKHAEKWRAAIESAFTDYRSKQYKNGVVTVYGSSAGGNITIVACLESHQFEPRNFW